MNAYLLSDRGRDLLYPSITPVNSFRVIFDTYFDGHYGLLEDISYDSDWENDWYNFNVVSESNPDCVLK